MFSWRFVAFLGRWIKTTFSHARSGTETAAFYGPLVASGVIAAFKPQWAQAMNEWVSGGNLALYVFAGLLLLRFLSAPFWMVEEANKERDDAIRDRDEARARVPTTLKLDAEDTRRLLDSQGRRSKLDEMIDAAGLDVEFSRYETTEAETALRTQGVRVAIANKHPRWRALSQVRGRITVLSPVNLEERGFWLGSDLELNHGDRVELFLFRYRMGSVLFGEQDTRVFTMEGQFLVRLDVTARDSVSIKRVVEIEVALNEPLKFLVRPVGSGDA